MINTSIAILILFTHWLADFVFQSDWMSKNKSSDNRALFLHILCYWIVLVSATYTLFGLKGFLYATVNSAAHLIVDYFTSRISKRLWQKGMVHEFFVCIGFDQFLHLTILVLTIKLL